MNWISPLIHYEKEIARIQLSRKNVSFPPNRAHFDDRLLQKHLILERAMATDIALFGSSTVLQFQGSLFPGRTFSNYGVRRGVLEDYLGLYQVLRDAGREPRHLILCLDSWSLDAGYWKGYWRCLLPEVRTLVGEWDLPLPSSAFQRPFPIRLADLRESGPKRWRCQWNAFFGHPVYQATTEHIGDAYIRRADGSVGYHPAFREQTPDEVEAKIQKSVRFPEIGVDSAWAATLGAFLRRVGRGRRVTLLLPPMHPAFFSLEARADSIVGYRSYLDTVRKAEATYRALAAKAACDVVGSFDPTLLGFDRADFYDWIHIREAATGKIPFPKR